MTSATLYRLGGWSAIVGGVLLAANAFAHVFVNDLVTPTELVGLPPELWHVPGVVGIVLVLFGLIAIYLRQFHQTGKLGLIGFVLLVVGIAIGAGYSMVFHAVFMPALEELSPRLPGEFSNLTTTAEVIRGIVVQAFGLGLGAILFGVATIRGGALPRIGGWLFIVAALFSAANQVTPALQFISVPSFALGFIWLGAALRKTVEPPPTPPGLTTSPQYETAPPRARFSLPPTRPVPPAP
jgi:hypothetical protein